MQPYTLYVISASFDNVIIVDIKSKQNTILWFYNFKHKTHNIKYMEINSAILKVKHIPNLTHFKKA